MFTIGWIIYCLCGLLAVLIDDKIRLREAHYLRKDPCLPAIFIFWPVLAVIAFIAVAYDALDCILWHSCRFFK